MEEPINFERFIDFFRDCMSRPPIEVATWYTTLNRIKYVCRMNGLTIKQAGRLVKKVANGRLTVNQVMDHLSEVC